MEVRCKLAHESRSGGNPINPGSPQRIKLTLPPLGVLIEDETWSVAIPFIPFLFPLLPVVGIGKRVR